MIPQWELENGGGTAASVNGDCSWKRLEQGRENMTAMPPPPQDSCCDGCLGLISLGLCVAFGFGAGVWVGRRSHRRASSHTPVKTTPQSEKCDAAGHPPIERERVGEESHEILKGAVQLVLDKHSSANNTEKVVAFLDPDEMRTKLFPTPTPERLSLALPLSTLESVHQQHGATEQAVAHFLELLQLIQRYSVDTSHKFFVNQLCGAVDPIALAAELLATSLNASVYTYETAPVFTMLEHEVIQQFGRLVYQLADDEVEADHLPLDDLDSTSKVDGMMLPGGSLSNLTAIHVARSYWQRLNDVGPYRRETDVSSAASEPRLVALVSEEAHYSFKKAASVTGIRSANLIVVPTTPDGPMDVLALDRVLQELGNAHCVPFFVAATAGSTVRGSFDNIAAIVDTCRKHERRLAAKGVWRCPKIWVHVDGAWGGAAIFSSRPQVRRLLQGVSRADSFTYNPHKMLGAPLQTTTFVSRHEGVLHSACSTRAGYLFDPRKCGARFDLGDSSFTCSRRTDAIKFWALWKYYGRHGLGQRVDDKVDATRAFAVAVQNHESFMLACPPCPFNVNFFFLPRRIQAMLKRHKISTNAVEPLSPLPDDISNALTEVSVELKRRLHRAEEMLVPFQPLSTQKAMCFRFVLAGNKPFGQNDIERFLMTMEKYGVDL